MAQKDNPNKKKSTAKKSASNKKAPAKNASVRKTAAQKTASKKTSSQKAPAKKTPGKKAPVKKTADPFVSSGRKNIKTQGTPKQSRPERPEPRAQSAKKKSPVKKIAAAVFVIAFITAAGLFGNYYYKTAVHYSEHFFPGTFINGTDCSEMTAAEAKQTIQQHLNDYSFTFTDHEGRSSTVTAPEIDILYSDNGEVEQALNMQDHVKWLFREKETESFTVTSGYTYDHDKLHEWIVSLPCLNDGTPSTDAFEYQGDDGFWYIEPETYGDEIYSDIVESIITDTVDNAGTEASLDGVDCFLKPSVTSEDELLTASVKEKNDAIIRASKIDEITDVTITMNSYIDKVSLNEELLREMIVDDENGDPVIDKEQVRAWIYDWAQERGLDEEKNLFVTHGGRLMYVGNGILQGWSLDVEATAERAWQAVTERESGIVFPVTTDKDGNLQSDMTYVEINIMKQKMWFYLEGKQLVSTPVVTGDIMKGYDTPSNGIWSIYYKTTDYTMHGPRLANGQYEYVTHVSYWMPFNDQIGIHDMVTRPEFGGEIYKWNGSHGCVNTPIENVAVIYENAPVGTPVVVHS